MITIIVKVVLSIVALPLLTVLFILMRILNNFVSALFAFILIFINLITWHFAMALAKLVETIILSITFFLDIPVGIIMSAVVAVMSTKELIWDEEISIKDIWFELRNRKKAIR